MIGDYRPASDSGEFSLLAALDDMSANRTCAEAASRIRSDAEKIARLEGVIATACETIIDLQGDPGPWVPDVLNRVLAALKDQSR